MLYRLFPPPDRINPATTPLRSLCSQFGKTLCYIAISRKRIQQTSNFRLHSRHSSYLVLPHTKPHIAFEYVGPLDVSWLFRCKDERPANAVPCDSPFFVKLSIFLRMILALCYCRRVGKSSLKSNANALCDKDTVAPSSLPAPRPSTAAYGVAPEDDRPSGFTLGDGSSTTLVPCTRSGIKKLETRGGDEGRRYEVHAQSVPDLDPSVCRVKTQNARDEYIASYSGSSGKELLEIRPGSIFRCTAVSRGQSSPSTGRCTSPGSDPGTSMDATVRYFIR